MLGTKSMLPLMPHLEAENPNSSAISKDEPAISAILKLTQFNARYFNVSHENRRKVGKFRWTWPWKP